MVEMREIKIIPLLPPNVLRVYKRKPKMKKKKKTAAKFLCPSYIYFLSYGPAN